MGKTVKVKVGDRDRTRVTERFRDSSVVQNRVNDRISDTGSIRVRGRVSFRVQERFRASFRLSYS